MNIKVLGQEKTTTNVIKALYKDIFEFFYCRFLFYCLASSSVMKRIKELIDTVGKKPTGTGLNGSDDIDRNSIKFVHHIHAVNPIIDQELIQHIDPDFFNADTDPKLKELKSLPGDVAIETVEAKRNVLCNQLAAVTKKLSDVILDNQPSYAKELKRVQELQQSLHNAFVICSNGRRYLKSAQEENSELNLGLLSKHKKQRQLCLLLDALRTIKTLQNTDLRLREMLQEEEYDDAVQLCLECKQVASTYRQYNCIKDLTSKLQDTLEQMEEQIDVALSRTCHSFDSSMYRKLQASYQLLGKSQAAADQLLMHYTTCIHNVAQNVVTRFAFPDEQTDNNDDEDGGNIIKSNSTYSYTGSTSHDPKYSNFRKLCSIVDKDSYISCLLELCKSLWKVMLSYHQTIEWHHNNKDEEDSVMEAHVMKRLTLGRHRVWADVQSRVKSYFLSVNLNGFKYDDFIMILDLVKRFIRTGHDFCSYLQHDDTSTKMKEHLKMALHEQTLSYFRTQHRSATEELVMFIEHESWHPIPVKSNFNVLDMQEFRFLQRYDSRQLEFEEEEITINENDSNKYLQQESSKSKTKTPFDDFMEENEKSAKNKENNDVVIVDDVSSDEDGNLDDYVEADDNATFMPQSKSTTSVTSSSSQQHINGGPIITNSALHVLRLCGNYMKMGDTLKQISVDVVVSMCQLFEIYFYSIVTCFSTEERRKRCANERLEATLKGIKQTLFTSRTSQQETSQLHEPQMSAAVDLNDENSIFAIQHRIVALQSLSWLAEQFSSLRPHLDQMMSENKKPFLNHFYSQTIELCSDVRWVVTYEVVSRLKFFKQTVTRMSGEVNWNVDDIMTQHNRYVDSLLDELNHFKQSLHQTVQQLFPLPGIVEKCIWRQCIILSNHSFVEGFASVKVCSNEGRALMQLDYQQFLNKLEKITNIRPIPNREFVESYIKAFYLIESDLERWVEQHTEYSSQQLSSLLQSTSSNTTSGSSTTTHQQQQTGNSTKQRVLSLIEDFASRK